MTHLELRVGAGVTYGHAEDPPSLIRREEFDTTPSKLLAKGELKYSDTWPIEAFAYGDKVVLALGANEKGGFGKPFWAFPPTVIDASGRYEPTAPFNMSDDQIHRLVKLLSEAAINRIDHHPIAGNLRELPPPWEAENASDPIVAQAVQQALTSGDVRRKLELLGHWMIWDVDWFEYTDMGTCGRCGRTATIDLAEQPPRATSGHALRGKCPQIDS